MRQTLKHICIFLVFLLAMLLWSDARPYVERLTPRLFAYRETLTIFIWTTAVVAIFHLLFYYLGKLSDRAVYIISAILLFAGLCYYGTIDLF